MVKWWEPMAVESGWGGIIHLLVIVELVLYCQLKFTFIFNHEPCEVATIIIFFFLTKSFTGDVKRKILLKYYETLYYFSLIYN